MQTMNSAGSQSPPLAIRIILLILGIGLVVGAVMTLSGARFGYFYVPLFAATFLLLHKLSSVERSRAKKEAPGRMGRPGA